MSIIHKYEMKYTTNVKKKWRSKQVVKFKIKLKDFWGDAKVPARVLECCRWLPGSC